MSYAAGPRQLSLILQVAIKLLPRGDFIAGFKTYVQREIMHQGSLKHPFIVALKEARSQALVSQSLPIVPWRKLPTSPPSAHPHSLVHAIQVFLTPTHLAIVMEYARGGDLLRYTLKHYPAAQQEDQARWIFQQLVIGLDYCHKMVRYCTLVPPLDLGRQHGSSLMRHT